MEITLNLLTLKNSQLTPNQIVLLNLLYNKRFDDIADIFGHQQAIEIRNSLLDSPYILSKQSKFTDTIISKSHVEKLLGIKPDQINFWEFYNCYPVRVGTRILRSAGPTTQVALKHEKKYLTRVKTKAKHELAIKAITAFVAKKKSVGELKFLPNMETVMNNSMWEQWEIFINPEGSEEQEWNTDTI